MSGSQAYAPLAEDTPVEAVETTPCKNKNKTTAAPLSHMPSKETECDKSGLKASAPLAEDPPAEVVENKKMMM